MQIKKSPSSSGVILQFRANRQLVQANKKALQEGLVASSNKDLVEAASKIQVTKKEPVKPGHVPFQERIPTSPPPEEAAKQFSTCYLEKLQSEPGSDVIPTTYLDIENCSPSRTPFSVGVMLQIHRIGAHPNPEAKHDREPGHSETSTG